MSTIHISPFSVRHIAALCFALCTAIALAQKADAAPIHAASRNAIPGTVESPAQHAAAPTGSSPLPVLLPSGPVATTASLAPPPPAERSVASLPAASAAPERARASEAAKGTEPAEGSEPAESTERAPADRMFFWNQIRAGGNSFNRVPPSLDYFRALKAYGADWVRLAYDKWRPEKRDFLMGNADDYTGLVAADLATLRSTLDRAHAAGLKVVIAPLSLPGMRWSQNNDGRFDDRLWREKRYWDASSAFWRDVAAALKDHPAVAAYNIVNEPAPERQSDLPEHASVEAMQAWYATHRNSTRDLPAFYTQIIEAIREVDPDTPVMVDAGWFAAADALAYWPYPLDDQRVLYSVHMYEPYSATSAPNLKRAKPYAYPGIVPFAGASLNWDAARVAHYLTQPFQWAAMHSLPPQRMVIGEFGCVRQMSWCPEYLEDVLTHIDRLGAHWAFYSFREDTWDAMDYERGSAPVSYTSSEAIDDGAPAPVSRAATPQFEPIRKRLQQPRLSP